LNEKLERMLTGAGYSQQSDGLYAELAEISVENLFGNWGSGNKVLVPRSALNGALLYDVWVADEEDKDIRTYFFSVNRPLALVAINIGELEVAARAYQTVRQACFIVPERNVDRTSNDSPMVIYEFYLF